MTRDYTIHHAPGHHLTFEDRRIIERVYNRNLRERRVRRLSQGALADSLGIPRSTFSREIGRGRVPRPNLSWTNDGRAQMEFWDYSAQRAQDSVDEGAMNKGCAMRMTTEVAARLRELVRDGRRSPFNAVAIMRTEGFRWVPCARTVYNHIEHGDIGISRSDTPYRRHRRRKGPVVPRRALTNPGHVSIEDRPGEVESRGEFGHWEMDTIVSGVKGRGGLLVLCERKTRFAILEKLETISQSEVARALKRIIASGGMKHVRSITTDNGSEFSDRNLMVEALRSSRRTLEIYYTHAYTAWEKGSVENLNRIIRRWYRKGTDFRNVSAAKVDELQSFINSIPRLATLKGKTANEAFSLAA